MSNLEIIGYSGHAYVCIEVAHSMGLSIDGYYDLTVKEKNPYHLNYLGLEHEINGTNNLFPSVGSNRIRRKIYNNIADLPDNKIINLIDTSAVVSKSTTLNTGILICPRAVINAQVFIAEGVICNTGSIIEHECSIGAFSHIAPGAVLAGNVSVGESTFIGANSTVKEGTIIGSNVIIGAGAVVINDIPNNTIVVGNPARQIKTQ